MVGLLFRLRNPTFSLELIIAFTFRATGFHQRRDNANGLFVTAPSCSRPLDLARYLTTRKQHFPLLCKVLEGKRGCTASRSWTIDIWYLRTSKNRSRHAVRQTARGLGTRRVSFRQTLGERPRPHRTVAARGEYKLHNDYHPRLLPRGATELAPKIRA